MVEIWSATNAPLAYRELMKTTGQPSVEIGASTTRDPDLGKLQAFYVYQPSTGTIYRAGALPAPPQWQPPSMSPEQAYRRLIADPGVHLVGTRSLYGHNVHVVRSSPTLVGSATFYIDQDTYMPIMTVQRSADLTSIRRLVDRKTLPATEANLKLTALTKAHPGARIRPATPRIQVIYGQATTFDNVTTDGVSAGGMGM